MTGYFCLALLAVLLAWIVVEDMRRLRIPDAASLTLIAAGLACTALHGDVVAAAVGAVCGYGFMVAVERLYLRLRGRDGLGRGDAKLFAGAGAWVGWQLLPMVLLIGAGAGLVFALARGRPDAPVPFGPFLALGIAVVVAAGRIRGPV